MRIHIYKLINKENFEEIYIGNTDNDNEKYILEYHKHQYKCFLEDENAKWLEKLYESESDLYKKLKKDNLDLDKVYISLIGYMDMKISKNEEIEEINNKIEETKNNNNEIEDDSDGFQIIFGEDGRMYAVPLDYKVESEESEYEIQTEEVD